MTEVQVANPNRIWGYMMRIEDATRIPNAGRNRSKDSQNRMKVFVNEDWQEEAGKPNAYKLQ